jgi:hypothetical protein
MREPYGKSEILKSEIFLSAGLDKVLRRPPDGQIKRVGTAGLKSSGMVDCR